MIKIIERAHKQLSALRILSILTLADAVAVEDAPRRAPAVWEVSPHNEGDLLLSQLLHCNVQGIGLPTQLHHHRSIHAAGQTPPLDA